MSAARRMIARACTWLILMALAIGGSSCAADTDIDCGSYKFSTQEWREAGQRVDRGEEGDALKARRRAADALVECRLLRGKTRKQVRRVLGVSRAGREPNAWFYFVGKERGPFSIDEEVLAVQFKGNRVAKVSTEVW